MMERNFLLPCLRTFHQLTPQPEIAIVNAEGTNEKILTATDRINIHIETNGDTTICETANDTNASSWSPVGNKVAFWAGIENQYG